MASSIIATRKNPTGRRAGASCHLFAYTTAFSVSMYALLFLWSMSSSGPRIAHDLSAGNVRSLPSMPVHTISVHQLDIDMAEFAYENQKGERSEDKPISSVFSRYGANWPCFWGETAVGDLKTWQDSWHRYKDGWKYVCGLSHITDPCVVYSLGSSGNMAFEKELLTKAPHCEIHTFDKQMSPSVLNSWFTEDQLKTGKVHTHEMFISSNDDLSASPPHRSVSSIMAELGHTHIDILKV
ncbi:hypothetical protein ACHAXN_006783 [Cyclotella atomus]